MELQDQIDYLKRTKCCGKPVFGDSFADFPAVGKEDTLYVDKATGTIYLWDGDSYVKLYSSSKETYYAYLGNDLSLISSFGWQKMFPSAGTGSISLDEGIYHFESQINLTNQTNSVAGNFSFVLRGEGTAVLTNVLIDTTGAEYGIGSPQTKSGTTSSNTSGITFNPIVTASTATSTGAVVTGVFTVVTGGTITPSIVYNIVGTPTLKAGTYIKITKLSDSPAITYSGPWV